MPGWEVSNKHPCHQFQPSFPTNRQRQLWTSFVIKTFDLPPYPPPKFVSQDGLIFRYHKHPVLPDFLWLLEKLWAMPESHTFYCVSAGMRFIFIGLFSEWSWLALNLESRIPVIPKPLEAHLDGLWQSQSSRVHSERSPVPLWMATEAFTLALRSNSPSCMNCAKAVLQNIHPYHVAFLAAVSVLFYCRIWRFTARRWWSRVFRR